MELINHPSTVLSQDNPSGFSRKRERERSEDEDKHRTTKYEEQEKKGGLSKLKTKKKSAQQDGRKMQGAFFNFSKSKVHFVIVSFLWGDILSTQVIKYTLKDTVLFVSPPPVSVAYSALSRLVPISGLHLAACIGYMQPMHKPNGLHKNW